MDFTALATDRPDGGRGFEAKFKLIYGFPGSGNMGGVFKTKTVILPNISSSDDPVGYSCQGQVSIDRAFIPGATTILIRIERESPQDNHVAFQKESIVLQLDEEETEEEEEKPPLEGDQLPETDTWEDAILIQSGTYIGDLGEEDSEGHRDNDDYYRLEVEEGQLITLQLTIPGNASYSISLLNSNNNSRGSSITRWDTKTLDYVADSTGPWYIRVSRSSGEGEYQLSVNDFTDGSEGEENHPPIISSLVSSQNSVEVNQAVNLSCTASDGDGDTLTYNWTVNGQLVGGNTSSLNWVAPGTPGTYHITCTVSDSKGSQDSDSVSIIVIEPEGSSDQIPTQVLYQVKITTGTKMGAGTDANVYLALEGQNGENKGM
ncbi:MAG: immunoglobulin domain-containing protein [Atribacterota bacterium]|nr:immunoglobulin domain-containing protein [Atribacterota bacterium]MDD4895819.1 immunoglobulin domain-containing protein [Atribacterota bacterium]MDD5636860.1 immunoglobulin domain-containing protein [Atribacterota bacterium]